jgi:hypothetical protein
MNFWKVADLWHFLMTRTLGFEKYGAAGCDVEALVTGQLGHKYAAELYAIHIGSGQMLTLFNGDRAWDLSGGRPIPEGLPADIHARIVALEKRFAVHLAAHLLGPSTLAYGLSNSPAGMLAWMLERWVNWSDNGGNVETVCTKDDLLTHAMIFWVTTSIGSSMRTYANNNRYPWTPSHNRQQAIEAPTGITFVGYENPPGVRTDQRVRNFLDSDRAAWYNHVNLTAHDHGGHFIPWEIPDQMGRRPPPNLPWSPVARAAHPSLLARHTLASYLKRFAVRPAPLRNTWTQPDGTERARLSGHILTL